MHVAIYSIAQRAIEGAAEFDDPQRAYERAEQYKLECFARGGDWRVYSDARPFDWDIVDHKPTEAEKAAVRMAEITSAFTALDLAAVRPLRAKALSVATKADTDKLASLEAEADKLRKEYASLEKIVKESTVA